MAHPLLLPIPVSSAAGIRNPTGIGKSAAVLLPGDGERKCIFPSRRGLVCGLMVVGISPVFSPENANAAKRRPPPPPTTTTEEKKDPNVSGVLAKVLASKKRKEAMKDAVAKLREKGKTVNG